MEYRVIKYKPILKLNYFEYSIQERTSSDASWLINDDYYEPIYKTPEEAIKVCTLLREEEENKNTFEVIF